MNALYAILWSLSGLFALFLLLAAVWLVCLLSFRKNKEIEPYRGIWIAHRGLHDKEKPENSAAAFRAAKEAGFAVEFDLHLTSDGRLVVHHDDSTKRMCGEDLLLCEHTFDELRALSLPDGSQIPSFEELLSLIDGSVPMLIELKSDKGNAAALTEKTLKVLEAYRGRYLIESFDPRVLAVLRKRAPQILRGQLSGVFFAEKGLSLPVRVILTMMFYNIAARPDFIAYDVRRENALPLRLLRAAGAPVFFWTVRDPEKAAQMIAKRQTPIFETFLPDVAAKDGKGAT